MTNDPKIDLIKDLIMPGHTDPNITHAHKEHLQADTDELEGAKVLYLKTSSRYQITAFLEGIAGKPKIIPTGYPELDNILDGGLYEGLYVLGAVSSLGKTTFLLQMADQIAADGQDVLLFSLEMGRFELMAKSISRLTFKQCKKASHAKTTREVLTGQHHSPEQAQTFNDSVAEYYAYSDHIYIHEGMGNIGTKEVKEAVQQHIDFTGNAPVVIIDYLQILEPYNIYASDKQNTDKAVLELKRLSRDKSIPIIAISSFNRDNYTSPVNLASFKESGAIEYSSDVLLGLQLAGMDTLNQGDATNGKRTDVLRQLEEMKAANPRKTQLKILKNRNGKTGLSVYYEYHPMFNFFREIEPVGEHRPTGSGVKVRR